MSYQAKNQNAIFSRNNVNVSGNMGSAKSIVFVHGFGTDQNAWKEIASEFSDDFRLVLVDNVGAGNSDSTAFSQNRYLDISAYAEDLLEVCAALDLKDAVLVGHSVGAMIGILASLKAPQHFSKLVLIGASPRYLNDEGYVGGFTKQDLDKTYTLITSQMIGWAESFSHLAMGNPDQPHLAQQFATAIKSIPAERILTTLYSIFQADYRESLAEISKPTLLIQSLDDFIVPVQVAEFMHERIKGSQLNIIEAHGHLPHISAPYTVISAMREFVYAS